MLLLLKYWKYILAALVIISAALYVINLQHSIKILTNENIVLTDKLNISNKTIDTLQVNINKQNSAVVEMSKAADKQLAKQAEQLKVAANAASQYKQQAQALLRAKPTSPNMCDSANALINGELK